MSYQKKKKLILFSYHYPPDQSAGALRTSNLIKEITNLDSNIVLHILCSYPKRYGRHNIIKTKFTEEKKDRNIIIKRFYVPYLGQNTLSIILSYSFYFTNSIIYAVLQKPNITFATSAKLLTAFAATISCFFNKSKLYIDYRDTFVDNFFYFYRWKKILFLIPLFSMIERFVLSKANSVNFVSPGFKEVFYEIIKNSKLKKRSITFFTNGADMNFIKLIKRKETRKQIFKDKNFKSNYKIIYAGNLGEGQDIYGMLTSFLKDNEKLDYIYQNNITIDIYGSGSQKNKIESLLENNDNLRNSSIIKKLFNFKGLVKRSQMPEIYSGADCLLLNLANKKSLSMVIPTKVFEYASTNHPIIFAAEGFTKKFINKVDSTIYFNHHSIKSFIKAIDKSRRAKVNINKRNKFLSNYDTKKIYKNYAQHILRTPKN